MHRAKLTVRSQKALFIAMLNSALAFVVAKWIYIDTIQVTFGEPLSAKERRRLTRLNGGALEPVTTDPNRFVSAEILHQPTPEAIAYLRSIRPLHYVNRFDVALDLDFASWEDLWACQDAIRRPIYMKWHADREVTEVGETTYFGKSWERRAPTVYSDFVSKISGKPTLHIEARLFGTEACKSNGVRTLDDIADFDWLRVIKSNFGLAFIEPNRFRKNLRLEAERQTPTDYRFTKGQYMARRRLERKLQQNLGQELAGQSYNGSRILLPQLKAQDCKDAKLPIFKGAIVTVPFDVVIEGAQRAWVGRPSLYD